MKYLERIQRGIDFIEDNLDVSISFESIAKESAMSRWHFQRAFKALTGETLKSYIRSRRLSSSLRKLRDKNLRILDIALESGFESQESFTRAFKKSFSMTPGEYRSIGEEHLFMEKVQINEAYLKHINEHLSMTPEIIEQDERLFVGLKTTFYGVESEKNNIAEKLPKLWGDFLPRLKEVKEIVPNYCYGIIEKTQSSSDELNYYAVTEVRRIVEVPERMDFVKLPPTKYARFTHKGAVKNLNMTVNYIYSSWLAGSDFQYQDGADIEVYGSEYHPTSNQSVVFYDIPVF